MIGLPDIVQAVEAALAPHWRVASWELGRTRTVSRKMNVIPLFLRLEPAA
ncbi:hypothetical protein G3N55_11165 [Dissulfurirhabdus thermomarina]|uniref:Uncharacterized protein n=1 Tax=Dissulfurirhabdus thermomarina TaxID=1765737 RepID=A0A6N9TVE4_DISTH|nr:hypothetical protein [Dissulfurirhabdus thermomarina]NDY43397.1 hypothetical protein [Dissulfurirhabdus thermomarina]NMX23643.1 hypothetical protein [Dissulfurirhabdus thermomarina]